MKSFALATALYLTGLQAIRHDALLKLKFRYAHQIKTEINQLPKTHQ